VLLDLKSHADETNPVVIESWEVWRNNGLDRVNQIAAVMSNQTCTYLSYGRQTQREMMCLTYRVVFLDLIRSVELRIWEKEIYSSPPLSAGDTFQDLPRMPETADSKG
jgi:hypothetical protein